MSNHTFYRDLWLKIEEKGKSDSESESNTLEFSIEEAKESLSIAAFDLLKIKSYVIVKCNENNLEYRGSKNLDFYDEDILGGDTMQMLERYCRFLTIELSEISDAVRTLEAFN